MTTTTTQPDWMARSARRRHLELRMLTRPSDASSIEHRPQRAHSQSTASDNNFPQPSSPAGSIYSTATSSVSTTFSEEDNDKLQALQKQLIANTAQVQANELRMRKMRAQDELLSVEIQNRLTAVSEVNRQLNLLRTLLVRAERISSGEFAAE